MYRLRVISRRPELTRVFQSRIQAAIIPSMEEDWVCFCSRGLEEYLNAEIVFVSSPKERGRLCTERVRERERERGCTAREGERETHTMYLSSLLNDYTGCWEGKCLDQRSRNFSLQRRHCDEQFGAEL